MNITTPKFKSSDFKLAVEQLREVFDAHSLGILLMDCLERRPAEQIFTRIARPSQGRRLESLKKLELVGQITAGFFDVEEVAFLIIKELDRACLKERHIVASVPEAQAPERIGSYRAIALKRERAKLVWALARDERKSIRDLANNIIREFFAETADIEVSRAALRGDSNVGLKDLELARRLQDQAERLAEAAEKVSQLETRVETYEDERARLLALVGSREHMLRAESEARTDLEQQVQALKKALSEAENEQVEAERAKAGAEEARAAADELGQKVRRLTKLAGASKTLVETQAELERARRRETELERSLAKAEEDAQKQVETHESERARLRAEMDAVREELSQARKALAASEGRASRIASKEVAEESVAILLDQANLAATAAQRYERKVNFTALLEELSRGRAVQKAVAFVVDNGGSAFDAFCDTLRRSGWELRVKRPKRFPDGHVKADWDMGIAMEAIDLEDDVRTFVLASGDGDFAPLVRRLRRNAAVEVASFADGMAVELANAADSVVWLTEQCLE